VVKVRFHWVPESSLWEIREMHGEFVYCLLGSIILRDGPSGAKFWHIHLEDGRSWNANVPEILDLFDTIEECVKDPSFISFLPPP
jgi:hypothetical protein